MTLLRVLATRKVQPLGANARRRLNLRVVAATKVDLGGFAMRGGFRKDLHYRLNVVMLRIPLLRERKGEAPLLFAHFLKRAADRFGRPMPEIGPAVRSHLMAQDWPGNVRELLHFAERTALGLAREADAQPLAVVPDAGARAERVDAFEAALLRAAPRRHNCDVRATVEALGVPRKIFYAKLKPHGLQRADFD